MTQRLTVDATWPTKKTDATCRNWIDGRSGQVRMTNHAVALRNIARMINHCGTQMPRVVFSKAQPFADRVTVDSSPVYEWLYDDLVDGGRRKVFRVLSSGQASRTNTNALMYFQRLDNNLASDTNTRGPQQVGIADDDESTAVYYEAVHARGDVPGPTEHKEGIESIEDFPIWDVLVQDKEEDEVELGVRNWVYDHNPVAGHPVVATHLARLRSIFHSLRTTNLPIVASWAAKGVSNSYGTGHSLSSGYGGDETGIRINSDSYLNLLDGTTTGNTAGTRDGQVAGFPCFVKYQGRGDNTYEGGKKVRVQCRVLAVVTNTGATSAATVRFIGPDTFTGNSVDISISATPSSAAWYGASDNVIHLNSASNWDATDSERAKIDVFGTVSCTTTDNLYVYGIRCWTEYE